MIRALVVDDEPHARRELACLLEQTDRIQVLALCADALDARTAVHTLRPDVVFLDIEMPGFDGFQFLGMIEEELMPQVVFVTAYDEYALRAFEENALDYLLKPVEEVRLARTVERLVRNLDAGRRPRYPVANLTYIPCSVGHRIKLVKVSEVEAVRCDPAGVYAVCSNGEHFTDLSLKVLETRTDLFRCHRQYLVNLDGLDEILVQDGGIAEIRTRSGRRVPVSRRNLPALKKKMGL
jgi:two-component system, LytTR family, response regulator